MDSKLQLFDMEENKWFLVDEDARADGRRDGALLVNDVGFRRHDSMGSIKSITEEDMKQDMEVDMEELSLIVMGGIYGNKSYADAILQLDLTEQRVSVLARNFFRQRFSVLDLEDVYVIVGGRCMTPEAERYSTKADQQSTAQTDHLCDDIILIPKHALLDMTQWVSLPLSDISDMSPREWTGVAPLSSHSGLIFGGVDADGPTNDAYILHTDLASQRVIIKSTGMKNKLPVRSGHSMIRLPSGGVFVIGGEDENGDGLNDVWQFNIESGNFDEKAPHSKSMRPFLGAGVFPLNETTFCVYGGVSGWNTVEFSGSVDCMRMKE